MFEGLFRTKKYTNISGQEVKAKLDGNEKFLLFDVRTPEEYRGGHIAHSISLPLQVIAASVSKYARSKDTEIVVVLSERRTLCEGCRRTWRDGLHQCKKSGRNHVLELWNCTINI